MGLLGQMMAGGIANAAAGLGDSLEMREKLDAQARLQQSELLFQQHIAELKHGWDTEATAAQNKFVAGQRVAGRTKQGLMATQADVDAGEEVISEEQYKSGVPMTAKEQAEHDARMGLLNVQTLGAEAALKSKEDMRGELGKKYDDLVRAYGPEKGAAMFERIITAKDDSRGSLKKEYDDLVSMYGKERGAAMFEQKFSKESGEKPLFEKLKSSDPKTMAESEELYRVDPATNKRYRVSEGEGNLPKNNVGGMRPEGKSTGFQSFGSVEESLKAVDQNIKAYGSKHGIDTIDGFISRWSPESDGNDTQRLIDDASRVTGFKRGQKIDLGNPAVRAVLAAAIIRQEGSSAFLDGTRGSNPQGGGLLSGGADDGEDLSGVADEFEVLPKNLSQRKPGTIYRSPSGKLAMWDGTGLIAQ